MGVLMVIVMAMVLAVLFSLVAAVPLFFLWNWLMPAIFGLAKVTFLQAWGLGLLSGILFKNASTSIKSN